MLTCKQMIYKSTPLPIVRTVPNSLTFPELRKATPGPYVFTEALTKSQENTVHLARVSTKSLESHGAQH